MIQLPYISAQTQTLPQGGGIMNGDKEAIQSFFPRELKSGEALRMKSEEDYLE